MTKKIKFTKRINSPSDIISLGRDDKDEFKLIFDEFSKIALDNPIFKKAMEVTAKWQQNKITKIDSCSELISNYAEGLGVSTSDLYASLLIPELVSSFNKWIPNLLGFVPGCSSLFIKDQESKGIIHSRLLDYSAGVLLTSSERAVHIKNKDKYDVFGYTSAGFPIPTLSSINERGLSLAIHYKHGNFFNLEGSSIFEICYDILLNCKDINEAKKRLKNHQSIAHWVIYLSDQSNKVASIDIRGSEISFEAYNMKDYGYLYFNNKIMSHDLTVLKSQPYGHLSQCSMRRKSLDSNFKKLKPKSLYEALETLCFISEDKSKNNWSLSPLTISTVQAYSINNKNFESTYILGDTPKFYSQEKIYNSNVFKNKFELSDEKFTESNFQMGFKELALAQLAIDLKDYEKAYFHLQIAQVRLKGTHEFYITQFYFNVLEYMTTNSKEDLYYILKNFEQIGPKLPNYLKDHCHLFTFRILKCLDEKYDLEELTLKIKNKNLNEILQKEHKLKPFSIKMLKKLIYPRIELLDIIYVYS